MEIAMGDNGPVAMAAGMKQARSVTPSGEATPLTLTPSAYERSVTSVTPDHTTLTNSRERFFVMALSALLLFISGSLFGILISLLSDDRACPKLYWPSALGLNIFGSWLLECFEMRD
ncbi:uncharacterized protein LOC119388969 [Rhipicephalus sanguineus]|uniref:Uncharacterized protein n=1 Tax=Rhipicephalus sanguineus TaxID=34632 RepID=A0A9D4SYH4_RHISA|nr:uncharacterized protein LOC119388969 [Rhipicephalus sanguineus]KAH7956975.1 hypothetical protein HPB52_014025 [Rhipicephalus sanguineus]